MECNSKHSKLIPLSRVVAASIIDVYGDLGWLQQLHSHWAARGLKKLQNESLKRGKKSVLLHVSHNTHTATLPPDFDGEIFVGFINSRGLKEPLMFNNMIANVQHIEDIECEDKCPKCQQDKGICDDIKITQETEMININGTLYEKTIVKKLQPNGDYILEITTPIWDVTDEEIKFITETEFIAHLDLKECGCLEDTEANIETVKTCCEDIYCRYYAGCGQCSGHFGSYKIFEENGLIQFDHAFKLDKVYVEYYGFIPKINGQYQVPEIAFETLVEWTKFKSVQNKKSVNLGERDWYFQHYMRERRNMEKIIGRTGLSKLIQAIWLLPKFI